ncbi:hypothetical protein HOLleu_27602 [Holothuria leucospilota]|uniref:Uncharacterized protein n=1 Tax=Holothuria leucospilota TaxID=206669 RepID=A0A9Q1BR00_HOLLE|nr:hypothetical protein HOLleu_27602 [Holothuria leucospilota]
MQQEEEMEIEDVLLGDDDEEDMEVDEQNDANEEDFRNEGTKDEECGEAVCHITVESKKLVIWQGSIGVRIVIDIDTRDASAILFREFSSVTTTLAYIKRNAYTALVLDGLDDVKPFKSNVTL